MDKQEFIALETLYVEDEHGEAIELPVGTIIMFAKGDPVEQVMRTDRGTWGVRAGHVMPRVDVDPRRYWIMPDDFAKMIPFKTGWALVVTAMIRKLPRNIALTYARTNALYPKLAFEVKDGLIIKLEPSPAAHPEGKPGVTVTFQDADGVKVLNCGSSSTVLTAEEKAVVRNFLKRS